LRFRLGGTPLALPALMAGERLAGEGEGGKTLHVV